MSTTVKEYRQQLATVKREVITQIESFRPQYLNDRVWIGETVLVNGLGVQIIELYYDQYDDFSLCARQVKNGIETSSYDQLFMYSVDVLIEVLSFLMDGKYKVLPVEDDSTMSEYDPYRNA